MADDKAPPAMPPHEAGLLVQAYRDYRAAVDPHDSWSNSLLASTVRSAHAVGWSRRTIAASLGLTREKVEKLASWDPALEIDVQPYSRGSSFPVEAVRAHQKIEGRVQHRRMSAERRITGLVRSAHSCGWPYPALGSIIGISGERVRQFSESLLTTADEDGAEFTPYRPPKVKPAPASSPINARTRRELRELADAARLARRAPHPSRIGTDEAERTLDARADSEDLSALIHRLKAAGATWPELDKACGYKPGGARARMARHGYGKLPPSMSPYRGS